MAVDPHQQPLPELDRDVREQHHRRDDRPPRRRLDRAVEQPAHAPEIDRRQGEKLADRPLLCREHGLCCHRYPDGDPHEPQQGVLESVAPRREVRGAVHAYPVRVVPVLVDDVPEREHDRGRHPAVEHGREREHEHRHEALCCAELEYPVCEVGVRGVWRFHQALTLLDCS